jgi:hypothetical protein
MIRAELSRLLHYEERHRRLLARLVLMVALSLVVFALGTVLTWLTERDATGGRIHGIGDAAFFTATQLLTISSSLPDPVTTGGRIVDVGLEVWGIVVITAIAGSFAAFFNVGDS